MSDPLFFCEHLPAIGDMARLHGDEARHASASRRLKAGDALWLFDGRGGMARARFHALQDRDRALEAVIEERRHVEPPQPPVHLACALPKGDRAAVMLDMVTQLGMSSFTPLLCEHSVVKPGDGTLDRLRRVCLEACKQSRRAHLPVIHAPATLAQVLARGDTTWIAHPDGEPAHRLAPPRQTPLTILIGPEGGFSEKEIAEAGQHHATRVALGDNILRVETAAIALVGMVMLGSKTPSGT